VRRIAGLSFACLQTRSVEKFIEKNRLPHLLFYGPPGTGKTSTILAMARKIYGDGYKKQILEVSCIMVILAHAKDPVAERV
jgi:DNA polymerase III delta prime subunit